jgi:hypothetical protein
LGLFPFGKCIAFYFLETAQPRTLYPASPVRTAVSTIVREVRLVKYEKERFAPKVYRQDSSLAGFLGIRTGPPARQCMKKPGGAALDRVESFGVEFRQDFFDDVVITRRGEIVSPLALQIVKRWQRQRLEGPQKI